MTPTEPEPIWRQIVSRAAMIVLALLCLAGAAGWFYVAYDAFLAARENDLMPFSGIDLIVALTAPCLGLAWMGLFLLKRAVLPSNIDEDPPQVTIGDNWDWTVDSNRSMWRWWLDIFR